MEQIEVTHVVEKLVKDVLPKLVQRIAALEKETDTQRNVVIETNTRVTGIENVLSIQDEKVRFHEDMLFDAGCATGLPLFRNMLIEVERRVTELERTPAPEPMPEAPAVKKRASRKKADEAQPADQPAGDSQATEEAPKEAAQSALRSLVENCLKMGMDEADVIANTYNVPEAAVQSVLDSLRQGA